VAAIGSLDWVEIDGDAGKHAEEYVAGKAEKDLVDCKDVWTRCHNGQSHCDDASTDACHQNGTQSAMH
jgi:hypothetical protein